MADAERIHRTAAVSYTHLDVYKRQVNAIGLIVTCLLESKVCSPAETTYLQVLHTLHATDVYKRQALGIGAAVMVLVCHKNFTTRHLRRAALISAAFFGWAAWMHYMRASVYTQGRCV